MTPRHPPARDPGGDIPVELVTWAAVRARCRRVAQAVRAAGYAPEVVVAIARGGFVPARLICDYLDIHALASLKVEHYRGIHAQGPARIRIPLNADVRDRRVLLVDDVNDTGETLAAAVPHLQSLLPRELRTAVLDQKRVSPVRVDFCGREVAEWRWITYPWALIEDLTALLARLDPAPPGPRAARAALLARFGLRVSLRDLEAAYTFRES